MHKNASRTLFSLMAASIFMLFAAGSTEPEYDDDYSDDSSYSDDSYSSDGSYSSSGSGDALDGPTDTYRWTCNSYSSENTVEVVEGPCQSEQENYAKVFGCNDVYSFYSACRSFYGCLVNNSSGDYRENYQRYYDSCDTYQQ